MTKNRFALLVSFSSILFANGMAWVLPQCENYFIKDVDGWQGRLLFGGILGAYIPAGLGWVLTKKEEYFIPALIVFAVALGGVLASIPSIFSLIFLTFFAFHALTILIFFVSIFFVVRSACQHQKKVPQSFFKRVSWAALGFVILVMPLVVSFGGADFPRHGSITARHNWAMQKFNDRYNGGYPFAVDFIRKSPVIRKDVGEDMMVAPAVNAKNEIWVSMDGSDGYFTLEVKGKKGQGICKINTIEKRGKEIDWQHPPQWEFNGKTVALTPL